MKIKKCVFIFLGISSLFKSFGEVQYFSIDSLPSLSVIDLDSNKVINHFERAQDHYPYDSNSTDYDPNFSADFAFSFGNLDPSCGGQLFLTFFPSYHVPDQNIIDTSILIKRPRLDSLKYSVWPFFEIDNYYIQATSILPTNPINEFYLIKTNENHFALLRIKALLPTYFDPSLLCYIKNAIKIEWWIQNDGNYDKLCQAVDIINKNDIRTTKKGLFNNNNETMFDLMGRKCLNPISSGFSIIQNQNHRYDKNNHFFHFHGYQK